MPNFGHSKFLPVFLQWKGLNKFRMLNFDHSDFIPVFLGKIVRKNSEWPFLAILNFSDNFSVHITLIECNGLESNEICTFLDFYSEM